MRKRRMFPLSLSLSPLLTPSLSLIWMLSDFDGKGLKTLTVKATRRSSLSLPASFFGGKRKKGRREKRQEEEEPRKERKKRTN